MVSVLCLVRAYRMCMQLWHSRPFPVHAVPLSDQQACGVQWAALGVDLCVHSFNVTTNRSQRLQVTNRSLHLQVTNCSLHLQVTNCSLHLQVTNRSLHLQVTNRSLHLQVTNCSLHLQVTNRSLHLQVTNRSLHLQVTNRSLHLQVTNRTLHLQVTNCSLQLQGGRIRRYESPLCKNLVLKRGDGCLLQDPNFTVHRVVMRCYSNGYVIWDIHTAPHPVLPVTGHLRSTVTARYLM